MSYYPKGHRPESGDDVDDFDEYDPSPYGGGYDIILTYGPPIPPSDETCYTATSTSSSGFDYETSNYSSHAEPTAYCQEALDNEFKNYVRRKPHGSGVTHQPDPTPEYGSGYGRRTNYGEEQTEERYGGGRDDEYQRPSYGRRDDEDEGYGGHKKHGDDGSDEDDERKKHRHHTHRKHYDD
ncbi:hypothetical protein E3N88_02605 [Mikania micrantha]|uniref:Uncharacterized protein n=1 Tax=Mikania micrantha TaxID=192012 RepID=A0A5N6Q4F3_9ASTR|nr:hypothetical protein E3N88_44488 [Mikania micrantha]KAD7479469.1 hypothetical protein E3N88_02605 [Mikania micrantha]